MLTSLFIFWKNYNKNVNKKLKTFILNFGPQHPAAHGVLRLILQLKTECIETCDIHVGLLHRGSETLIESKSYIKGLPYFDRLDYVSMLCQEHAYCLGIEALLGTKKFTNTSNIVRTLFDEITRLLNHLLAIACHALDVGSMSVIFWAFEERELLMEFYERACGARMHAAFYRPNEITFILYKSFLNDILKFIEKFYKTLNQISTVLVYNKIWKQRLVNIGTIAFHQADKWNLTGVVLRSLGFKRDIRLIPSESYANYNYLKFRGFVGSNGDCYDRFLIRLFEMVESTNIINQCVIKLLGKDYLFFNKNSNVVNYSNNFFFFNKFLYRKNKNYFKDYISMEFTINKFKYWIDNFFIKKGHTSQTIESPKGEFGVQLVSDGTNSPLRCKIKSPSYFHLQYLKFLIRGHYLSDLAALIGTIDIVFGEIDR